MFIVVCVGELWCVVLVSMSMCCVCVCVVLSVVLLWVCGLVVNGCFLIVVCSRNGVVVVYSSIVLRLVLFGVGLCMCLIMLVRLCSRLDVVVNIGVMLVVLSLVVIDCVIEFGVSVLVNVVSCVLIVVLCV